MDNQNQNSSQETDILVLLDYFKKGFKSIFRRIGNCFKFVINLILWFFVLLKRYMILVLTCTILCSILGYFNKEISTPSYNYEMVIQPNYNSTKFVYQLVDSYNELAESSNDAFLKNIKKISISPVKSFTNDLEVFYTIIDNNTKDKRDTIFSNEYKIENFRKNIANTDYPFHTIYIKSSGKLSPEIIKNKILNPIEKDPVYSQYKNSYLKAIDIRVQYYKNNLQRIDTLLLALAKGNKSDSSNPTLSIKGDIKNNLEDDLLNRSIQLTDALAQLEINKTKYSSVIKVISEPQLVDNKSGLIKRNTLSFTFYGFIFSICIILLIQFSKYLNKFEKEHS